MEKTKVVWEKTKDELYTFFAKCEQCNYSNIAAGALFCGNCGKEIENPIKITNH